MLKHTIYTFFSIVVLLSSSVANFAVAQESMCSIVDTAFKYAEDIRGLKKRKNVPCHVKNKKEIEKFLIKTIEKDVPEYRLKGEEAFYKLLGVLDEDYNYLEGLVTLYTSQIGGFYEPVEEYYALAAWIPSMTQLPVAVHELTHALQDQYYKLEEYIDNRKLDTDVILAHSAMIEGDATLVMLDFSSDLQGAPRLSVPGGSSSTSFIMQQVLASSLSAGMSKAPQVVQALLMFPYLSGLNFVQEYVTKNGYKGLDKVFKKPPSSTEEILHPKKYLNYLATNKKDYKILKALPAPKEWKLQSEAKPYFSDSYGEFFISLFLGNHIDKTTASSASSGWGGDRIAIYKDGSKYHLTWATSWDTKKDQSEFYNAITSALSKRIGKEHKKFKNTDFRLLSTENKLDITVKLDSGSENVNIYIKRL